MTDITAALELARKTIERLAVTHREINECGRMEAIRTLEACARHAADDAASLARALLALAAEREAMAKVVEAAEVWSASFGELSKRLPPHVHALRDAVDAYEAALDSDRTKVQR